MAAAQSAATAEREQLTAERAAAAKRRKSAEKAARVETRDRKRADELLKVFIAAGTRDRWSIIGVTVKIHAVSVHTDLAPGNGSAFLAACTQLLDREPWIHGVDVFGTDGSSHATWARGDAACGAAN